MDYDINIDGSREKEMKKLNSFIFFFLNEVGVVITKVKTAKVGI